MQQSGQFVMYEDPKGRGRVVEDDHGEIVVQQGRKNGRKGTSWTPVQTLKAEARLLRAALEEYQLHLWDASLQLDVFDGDEGSHCEPLTIKELTELAGHKKRPRSKRRHSNHRRPRRQPAARARRKAS